MGELSGDFKMTKKSRSKISFGAIRYGIGRIGSDSFFEIYTESYGDRPIERRRRRISSNGKRCFGDILRLSDKG
jgi:aspartokinase/homoserine dehydrogenase 1